MNNDIMLVYLRRYNNVKIVIFDFDGTLAIHRDKDFVKHRNESEDKRLNYYSNAYQNPNSFFEKKRTM